MSNHQNYGESNYTETCRVWKNKMLEKIKKSQNSANIMTNLSKKYWKAKTSVLAHNKKQRAKFFPLEPEFGVFKSQAVVFFKNSCCKIRDNMSLMYRKMNELNEAQQDLIDFLRNNNMEPSTHSYIMMVQISISLNSCLSSRTLMLPLVERIVGSLNQFIKHGITDAYKSCKEVEKQSIELQAGLHWMNDLSKEIDPDSPDKIKKFKEVQKYVKESRIKLQELTSMTSDKYTLLVTSRDLILTKEFKLYFETMIANFKKCRDEFEKYLHEFSGLPHFKYDVLEPILGPNNGVNSIVVDKYIKPSLVNDERYTDLVEKLSICESETDLIQLNISENSEAGKFKPVNILDDIFNDKQISFEALAESEFEKIKTMKDKNKDSKNVKNKQESSEIDNLLIFPENDLNEKSKLSQKETKRLETLKDLLEQLDLKESFKSSPHISKDDC